LETVFLNYQHEFIEEVWHELGLDYALKFEI